MSQKIICLVLMITLMVIGCGKKKEAPQGAVTETPKTEVPTSVLIKDFENLDLVLKQYSKFMIFDMDYDASNLTAREKKALYLLVAASKYMNSIFNDQVYSKNDEIRQELKKWFKKDAKFRPLLDAFVLNVGPFDRLENDKPFVNLSVKKPLGANFYPEDMTKEEFDAHIKANPADEKNFISPVHVINRINGKLVAVPYSEVYKKELEKTSALMKEAVKYIDNASLKKYVASRADALLSNDYFQSDMDWMDIKDSKIEFTIGPYEVYEDKLFGYKASFEAFVSIVDMDESKKLSKIVTFLDPMEKNLPLDDKYKNFKRGKLSPMLVVNEVASGGMAKAGVQTAAYNLPNDERVREAKGSKKVLLKNMSETKFRQCLLPIASKLLTRADISAVSFNAYFNFILMHEISHGLGPGNIVKNGVNTSVSKELKELYSTIEELKADTLSVWNCFFLVKNGTFPKELEKNIYSTYLAGIFRSVRFGIEEAHGGANAIALSYLLEKQGFNYDQATGLFGVNKQKIGDAMKQLITEILEIEATGDYARAKQLIDKYKKLPSSAEAALTRIVKVPTDINPVFKLEREVREMDKSGELMEPLKKEMSAAKETKDKKKKKK